MKAALLAAGATGEYRTPSSGAPGRGACWTGGRGWPRTGSEVLGSWSCILLAWEVVIVHLSAIGLPLANVDQTGNPPRSTGKAGTAVNQEGTRVTINAVRDRRNQQSGNSCKV